MQQSHLVLWLEKQNHQRQGIRGKATEWQKGHISKGIFREKSPTPKKESGEKGGESQ